MNHDFDNDNDNDMDDDDAEEVPRPPKAPKNGTSKPSKKSAANKESERKKRELITMGKAKGFLTYDEVNEKGDAEAQNDDEDEETEAAASKKEEAEEEEDSDGYSKTNDPVRMYLRKMGSVSLLTREGEVEIAKRIED